MKIILLYIIGLLLASIGMFFIIINLNLFIIGYSFFDFVKFIISNIESFLFFIGVIILIIIYERT